MNTSLLTRFFADEHIKVICWMLIHSLWIGLIAAAIAGAVLVGTQKSSSQLRYRLLCGCLIIFVWITGFVFYQEIEKPGQNYAAGPVPDRIEISRFSSAENSFMLKNIDTVTQLNSFINHHSVWIFTVWFLCFALKSLGLIGGLFYVHRMRSYRTQQVGEEWKERLKKYSQKLGISQSINLLQSGLVKVPVTIGHFKPVILIPIGLIFQLPAEQIETILIHELAHIKRRDYLVNLLQSLLETIFFFNPGLLWLSSLIKETRETCCDDIVLANTSVKSNYLEALLAFQSKQPVHSNLVLGLGSNQLVTRLKRIINHENKRLNKMEKITLLAGLLIVSAFSYRPNPEQSPKAVAPTKIDRPEITPFVPKENPVVKHEDFPAKEKPSEKPREIALTKEMSSDTSWKFQSFQFVYTNEDIANRDMEVRDDKDNIYRVKIVNNKVVSLKVNNAQVPESEMGQHEKLLAEIDKSYFAARDSKLASIERARNDSEKKRKIHELSSKEWNTKKFRSNDHDFVKFEKSDSGVYEKKKIGKDKKNTDEKWDLKQDKDSRKEFKTEKDHLKEFKKEKDTQKRFKTDKQKDKEWKEDKKYRKGKEFSKAEFAPDNKPDELFWAKGKGVGEKWKNQSDGNDVHRIAGVKKRKEPVDIYADQQRVRGVIADLVLEKVISKSTDMEWFGLSDDELVVNGNKQPEELLQKLKEKYEIKAGHGLYYGPVKVSGKGVFLDKGDL